MIIDVHTLSKEDRIEKIFESILFVDRLNSSIYNSLDRNELSEIIKLIEYKIDYVSQSPSFEFRNSIFTSESFKVDTIQEFKSLMDTYPNKFFIIHSISLYQAVYSNSAFSTKYYNLRGVFIDDLKRIRDSKINSILGD